MPGQRPLRASKSDLVPVEADEMAQKRGAQAEFLTVYFCTNGVGTLVEHEETARSAAPPRPGR